MFTVHLLCYNCTVNAQTVHSEHDNVMEGEYVQIKRELGDG
jgi:hypothetical protein